MTGFEWDARSGRIVATFAGFEGDLMRTLARQVVTLLGEDTPSSVGDPLEQLMDIGESVSRPDDPVLQRLLPDAYEDDESAADFRRFTEPELRASKAESASVIAEDLDAAGLPDPLADSDLTIDVELDAGRAMLWMRGLNDLRLALSVRLGIETSADDDEYADSGMGEQPMYDVYRWLGMLQETLIEGLQGSLG